MYTLSSLTQQEMLDAKIRYPTPGKVQVLLLALTLNYEVFPLSACGLVFLSRVTLMRKKRKGQDTLKEEEEPEEERK